MACNIRVLTVRTPAEAGRELASIGLDPFSIRNMGPKMIQRLLLLEKVGSRESDILKTAILAIGGDAAVGVKGPVSGHGDYPVILMGTEKQLRKLCTTLMQHVSGLPHMATEILRVLDLEATPDRLWAFGNRRIDLSRKPCIMGILNVTPDSFSDGNRHFEVDKAVDRALQMEDEGADIIDIGGESTRPRALPVSIDDELSRVIPVIEKLSGRLEIPLSVDTFKATVAKESLAAGVEIVNDISGLNFDEKMAGVIADSDAGLVLMHTRGKPAEMQNDTSYTSIISEVVASLRCSLVTAEEAGIETERIVVDPGIGFGKSVEGNLEILRKLTEFACLGRPILIGTSRKSFIGSVLNLPVDRRIFGTAATVALALANGASILRVHDVKEMRDVADMAMAVIAP